MLTSRTVYSLYFPETRRLVDALWSERPHHLYERNYEKHQDDLHRPFLARWRAWAAEGGIVFGDRFEFEYPTAGASEGIQALLARIATAGGRPRVHVFDGEYEGYSHLAAALSLPIVTHGRDPELHQQSLVAEAHPGDWFFVSQPSAIDGSAWPGFSAFVGFMAERLPEVSLAVDLTYVGSVARRLEIDLSAPNVSVVLASLSKPFGVYYHRIGALLSRSALPSLYGNLWFKNLFSLALGERLLAAHGPADLPTRYLPVQREAFEQARQLGELPAEAEPADVVLLACARLSADSPLTPGQTDAVRAREPGKLVLRWCLTPAMDRIIRERGDA